MRSEIKIGTKTIGENHPLFIVSECGVTCNQSVELAQSLVDATADAGADAIKFTLCFPEEFMSDRNVTYSYETVHGTESENMYDMLQNHLSIDDWRQVQKRAEARGIIMFASIDSSTGIEYCEALNFPAYKMSSWDFNHIPLWRSVAALGKPILIDTGPVTTLDVAKVMQVMEDAGNDQAVLVHCFHTQEYNEMNMRAIPYMRKAFHCPVGYSPDGRDDETDIISIGLGACVLEKRLTIDRNLSGHHHILSKEPDEFREYVTVMRNMHAALGQEGILPSSKDLEHRKEWFRHIVVDCDIPAGTVLTEEMLEGKRPESGGVSPEYMEFFVGRKVKRSFKKNEAVTFQDV